jgi:5-methylcytosine-specific restriction endonuclease McrA
MVALVLRVKGRTCHLCRRPGATTADHVVPRSQGGGHDLANLEPAHKSCNLARGDRTLAEWEAAHPIHLPTLPPSREW